MLPRGMFERWVVSPASLYPINVIVALVNDQELRQWITVLKITGERYASLLNCLKINLQEKRQQSLEVYLNNTPSSSSTVVVSELMELVFQLVWHHPLSSNMSPSRYYLILNMEKLLKGKRLCSNCMMCIWPFLLFESYN